MSADRVGRAVTLALFLGGSGLTAQAADGPRRPHEPIGYQRLTYRPFVRRAPGPERVSSDVEDGWYDRPGRNSTVLPASEIPSALGEGATPGSPPNVAQFRFPVGLKWGTGPVQVGKTWPEVRSVYVSFWFQVSRNGGDSKICYIHWGEAYTLYLHTSGKRRPPHQQQALGISIQGGAPNLGRNAKAGDQRIDTRARLSRGWHFIELLVISNSHPRQADGELRAWVDDREVVSRQGMAFTGGPKNREGRGITGIRFNPTYGPSEKIPNPEEWFFWVDDVYVSGR